MRWLSLKLIIGQDIVYLTDSNETHDQVLWYDEDSLHLFNSAALGIKCFSETWNKISTNQPKLCTKDPIIFTFCAI